MKVKNEHPVVGKIMSIWANGKDFKRGITKHGLTVYEIAEELDIEIAENTLKAYLLKDRLYAQIGFAGTRFMDKYALNFGSIQLSKHAPITYGIADTAEEHVAICDKAVHRAKKAEKKADGVKMLIAKELTTLGSDKKADRLTLLEALGKKKGRKKKK